MLNGVLYGLTIIVWLALAGLLVFLCVRTRSKGLMLISAVLLTSMIFNSLFEQTLGSYMDRWIASEITSEGVASMNAGDFLTKVAMVKLLLYQCLCLLGGCLVYREWRQGKLRNPQPAHREELGV